jgi:hypothetical protein
MDGKEVGSAPRSIGPALARRDGCGDEAAGESDETLIMGTTTDKWIPSRGERGLGGFFAHKRLIYNT